MDKRVKSLMFTTPVTVFSADAKDSMGDRVATKSTNTMGYVYDEVLTITNYLGESEISSRQIYLPLDAVSQIRPSDLITCLDSTKSRIIKIKEYRGRNGQTLIGVVYLP
ncbi:MAG: hypothetical protein PHY48_14130 [Candidatus Cloacimonetes bacterium]|nr:hypothetical protein [Candidatus Cloacimonadota bacterium]